MAENLRLNNVKATGFPAAADVRDGEILMEIALRDFGHKVLHSSNDAASGLKVKAL